MPRITLPAAQAWAERTKLRIDALDIALLTQIEAEVLARIGAAYDISTWTDEVTTPELVQVAIAKKYISWVVRRAYSESIPDEDATYALLLDTNSEVIIIGLIDGSIDVPGLPPATTSSPVFYPSDNSSAMTPTRDDPSLGPAKFSMGMVF